MPTIIGVTYVPGLVLPMSPVRTHPDPLPQGRGKSGLANEKQQMRLPRRFAPRNDAKVRTLCRSVIITPVATLHVGSS
jgi:hypothetical protein